MHNIMQQVLFAISCTLALLLTFCWTRAEGKPTENQTALAAPLLQDKNSTMNLTDVELPTPCDAFASGKLEFTTPNYPHSYPNDTNCVKIIDAGPGKAVWVRFVDTFHIEIAEDGSCKYDYLEVRDGQFGYSPLKELTCGTQPPTKILSTGRYMWLLFHSDASIGYNGFRAIIEFVPVHQSQDEVGECYYELHEIEGHINVKEDVDDLILHQAYRTGKHVDCTWVIMAEKGKKVFLQIEEYRLEQPNDCAYNVIEIYKSKTELDGRGEKPKELCGSTAEVVKSDDNYMAIRLKTLIRKKSLEEDKKKLSKFEANYTIFREITVANPAKGTDPKPCVTKKENPDDYEFDCQDNTCIHGKLWCNGFINCQLRNDEEKCPNPKPEGLTADIFVISFLGVLLVVGMCGGMVLNITRKLRQDKEELVELKEALRKSRESNLQSDRHVSILEGREPSQGSHTSKETVIERPGPSPLKPNGDLHLVRAEVLPRSMQAVAVTPPSYTKAIMKRRSSSSDIPPPPPPKTPDPPPTCIEVRDCACQTRDSFLARLHMGHQFHNRRTAPLAIEEQSPVRRVSFPYFTYAASSASSETGRSLERLDECSE